eukprot:Amastigsp_a686240_44.p3 type:complete len:108 gc:universal Amastigsp_a686240_44:202-525(+)
MNAQVCDAKRRHEGTGILETCPPAIQRLECAVSTVRGSCGKRFWRGGSHGRARDRGWACALPAATLTASTTRDTAIAPRNGYWSWLRVAMAFAWAEWATTRLLASRG